MRFITPGAIVSVGNRSARKRGRKLDFVDILHKRIIIGAIYMRLARGVEDYYEISRIARLCSEPWCREVDRQLRSMASFKISGHIRLLHR
jgi:hypothetical protein